MFWKSILQGFNIFVQPAVGGGCLVMALAYLGYRWVIARFTNLPEGKDAMGPGCLIQVLGLLIQGLMIAFFVLLLLPVFLGTQTQLSWSSVEPMGFVAVRSGLLATFIVTLASFFPLIGPLIGNSPGLESFLISCLTFRLLSPLYLEALLGPQTFAHLFPGVLPIAGYLLLTLILTRLLFGLTVGYLWRKKAQCRWRLTLGAGLDFIAGLLPFLMYTQWVRLHLP